MGEICPRSDPYIVHMVYPLTPLRLIYKTLIYSFHMLECPGSKIFKATTWGRKPGNRPPAVAFIN